MHDLLQAARAAFEQAHAPYSSFRVGAALRTAGGRVFAGANVENASYPEGNCAEASAIAAMVAAGERRIVEVVVVAGGERPCPPCGGCRQRLAEFAGPAVPVHLCGPDGLRRTVTLGELLPLAFELPPARPGPAPAAPPTVTTRTTSTASVVVSESTPGAPAAALARIRAGAPGFRPRVGLILGSGLGAIAEGIEDAHSFDYHDLPGFPRAGVEGHAGRLALGRFGGMPVACLQGRVHLYEGGPAAAVNVLIRTLRALGCEILILTNAAGSLSPGIAPGSIALIEDHINLLGTNPLIGANDDTIGPRFPDMSAVYDPALRDEVRAVAARLDIPLAAGVYLATLGPSFETPAEIRAFRALGADLVGMSTVPEAISARHAGLRVLGLSIVTNLAAGLSSSPLSHAETLTQAGRAAAAMDRLLQGLMMELFP